MALNCEQAVHLSEAFEHPQGGGQFERLLAPQLQLQVLDKVLGAVEATNFLARL